MLDALSEREIEILQLLGDGLSNRQIAEKLYLAPGTVKSHNHHIYSKLGVTSRVQALRRAQDLGLLAAPAAPDSARMTQEIRLPRHNLPASLTPFIGRENDMDQLETLLAAPAVRCITIQGPGGMGKTRLALEVASRLVDQFRDGVYLVELAPLASFDNQLVFSLRRFIHMLRSGDSLMDCFRDAANNAPEPTAGVFRQLIADLKARRDMLDALTGIQAQLAADNFGRVVDAIARHMREGSSLAEELDQVSQRLQPGLPLMVQGADETNYASDMLLYALASTLNFRFTGDTQPKQQMLDFLQKKQLLLIMDNCEPLLPGVMLFSDLLQAAPGLKIVATSRERLHLSVETVYLIGGLDVPQTPADIDRAGAGQLLLQCARRVQPDFEPAAEENQAIVQICQRTQGMPLAIMLAVGWLEMLSLSEIASELGESLDLLEAHMLDLPERQRSVRAAFASSWKRLSPDEQRMYARLAVFRGGFTRQAAERVAGVDLRTLHTFVNRSLVTIHESRYTLHELLRQYARERLEDLADLETARADHAGYYLDWLASLTADIQGQRQLDAIREIETELSNLRQAWQWAVKNQKVDWIDRALETLSLYFYTSDYLDGIGWLNFALEQLTDCPPALEGRLLSRIVLLRSRFRRPPELETLARRSLEIAQQHGDVAEIALSYEALANCALMVLLQYAAAVTYYQESLTRQEGRGAMFYTARICHKLGYCYVNLGDMQTGYEYTLRASQIAHAHGNIYNESAALHNLAYFALVMGDYQKTRHYLETSIEIADQIGASLGGFVDMILSYAEVLLLLGDITNARIHVDLGLDLVGESSDVHAGLYAHALASMVHSMDGAYAEAEELARRHLSSPHNEVSIQGSFALAQALATCGLGKYAAARRHVRDLIAVGQQLQSKALMAWSLPVIVPLLAHDNQPEDAVERLAYAYMDERCPQGWLENWPLLLEVDQQLQQALGEAAYQAAWERGTQLTLEAALAGFMPEDTE
jgi:predicted ATPase/DNA-binding CsgD family transcriptional regulator